MTDMKIEEDLGGHYRTSGMALIGMGGLAGLLGYLVGSLEMETGFIDSVGIISIGIIFVAVGGLMFAVDDTEGE